MAEVALIIGGTGDGKSHSIQYLNPKTTFIINVLAKGLPWKNSGKDYTVPKNLANTKKAGEIVRILDYINEKRLEIKDVVIDDHTHVYADYYLKQEKVEERKIANGEKPNIYRKFTHIAQQTIDIADKAKSMRGDLKVYIMHHTDIVEDDVVTGAIKIKAASFGRFVEEKLKGLPSQFTVVLVAGKKYNENKQIEGFFKTRDVNSPAKTPQGMFEDDEIPNNLQLVKEAMDCFYNDDCN